MILGTGVDITEVQRLRQAVSRWGDGFLRRVFTDEEIEAAQGRLNRYQHLAGRFAAKEAVFKALGEKELSWKDLQILNDASGRPYCVLINETIRQRNKKIEIHISISHVKNYAVASATVTKKA